MLNVHWDGRPIEGMAREELIEVVEILSQALAPFMPPLPEGFALFTPRAEPWFEFSA